MNRQLRLVTLYQGSHVNMYILKIKGKVKIPDYVQIRDDAFTLLAYFRSDRPDHALEKCGLKPYASQIKKIIEEIPYGKLIRIQLDSDGKSGC